jgi:hypothetical protein
MLALACAQWEIEAAPLPIPGHDNGAFRCIPRLLHFDRFAGIEVRIAAQTCVTTS